MPDDTYMHLCNRLYGSRRDGYQILVHELYVLVTILYLVYHHIYHPAAWRCRFTSRASYGVSIVRIWVKIKRVITILHCTTYVIDVTTVVSDCNTQNFCSKTYHWTWSMVASITHANDETRLLVYLDICIGLWLTHNPDCSWYLAAYFCIS